MAVKDRRREIRLSEADEDMLIEASGLVGVTVSEFLLDRALHDAEQVVRNHRLIELDRASRAAFIAALDAPLADNPLFAEQARRARRLKHVDRDDAG